VEASRSFCYNSRKVQNFLILDMKIIVVDKIHSQGIKMLKTVFEVEEKLLLSREELLAEIRNYDAILCRTRTRIDADVINAGKNLKAIARAGSGVDGIDIEAATRARIPVFNAPTGNTRSVAEYTLALILALLRHIPRADAGMKRGLWEKSELMGRELAGKTLGVVGFGRIGKAVAELAGHFGADIIVHDPYVTPTSDAKFVALEELLQNADIITLHVPLNETNRRMIGKEEFRLMKRGAYFINTARGELVDEEALFDALKSGALAGAALDVFSTEPFTDSRISEFSNLIATPHIAGSTEEGQRRAAEEISKTLIDYFTVGKVRDVANPEVLEK
jgi:D-3-phosphoglycerate dehydrogenase